MPKASAAEYTVTADGRYRLRKTSGQSVEYRRYQYKPLSSKRSIRLLQRIRAYPGDTSFDHFSIEERSLDDPTLKYVAISYVWGNSLIRAPLILPNEANGSICLITKTAWEAIETLCMFGAPLWIDQICINQEDDKEIKTQIGLMGEIYSSPRRVVTAVWLGAADNETKAAFDLVAELSKVMPLEKDIPINVNDAFHMPHDMVRKKIQTTDPTYRPPADDDPRWACLAKILARTWYSRMWTFQEVVLAELDSVSVMCASENLLCTTTLRRVIRASILLGDYPIPEYNDAVMENRASLHMINATQHRLKHKQPIPLHYLLQMTASRDCRDPKDKIYALLNVQRNDLPMDMIEVAPRKDPAEVYADTTRKIITSESSLLVGLSASGRHGGKAYQLPSWVPDYSGTILAPYLEALDPNSPLFAASCGRRWRPASSQTNLPTSWQQLQTQGRNIDTVEKIDDHVMPAKASGDAIYAYLCQILPTILSQSKRLPGEDENNTMMLRIAKTAIIGGYNTYLLGFRAFSFIARATSASYEASEKLRIAKKHENEDLKMLRHIFFEPPPSQKQTPVNQNERQWKHDFIKQVALCKGRRFAFLERYGVALVPHQTQAGDFVAILHGSSLPVILRRTQDAKEFHMVGPCFVDGIMFGEAVNWAEDAADQFVLV